MLWKLLLSTIAVSMSPKSLIYRYIKYISCL